MKQLFIISSMLLATFMVEAQDTTKKVWVSGAGRGVIYGDQYQLKEGTDSITPARVNSGHTLVDLAANIQPNSQTYINAMARVRNDYGGFWGGGVTFDLRQMYVKGVLANVLRYQLGDLDYKLTPYTFYNNEELPFALPNTFDVYQRMVHYDLFYMDNNTWRQQGVAGDFALQFAKGVDELQFNFFATRQNPTDFGFTSERLFYGGNINILQSPYFNLGYNYVEMRDLLGTSNDTTALSTPVQTIKAGLHYPKDKWSLHLESEMGTSSAAIENDTSYAPRSDFFFDVQLKFDYQPLAFYAKAQYVDVGPKFTSPGAQSLRLNYGATPETYSRYGKDQVLRPIALIDILRDASLYNYRLSGTLQTFLPRFGNAQPYGPATPNRRGFTLSMGQENFKEWYDIDASYQMLSEIVGQGTDALRTYATTQVSTTVHAASFFGSNRTMDVEFHYWNEQTNRSGEETFENVDLQNSSLSFGAEVETIEKLHIIFGYTQLRSQGFELMAIRDVDGVVVDFAEYAPNIEESLLALGIRYDFAPNNQLQFNWQQMLWNDLDQNLPAYQFNQLAIMYNLKF